MSEVVIDRHALHFSDFFHTPLDAFERAQRSDTHGRHHADMASSSQGRQSVGDVVLTGQLPLDHALGFTFEADFKA
ncbi:hypothetical protein D9M71_447120 [compost metagenome]